MSFLKERAEKFLVIAQVSFDKGFYDMVLFNVEQYIQLYVKYFIYLKSGDYPKSHDLIKLFNYLKTIYEKKCVDDFIKENIDLLSVLQQAYISSCYMPIEYTRDQAEKVLRLVEEFKEMVQQCLTS
ncbi:HEPN domain-containing protein [Sulfurisphaera javensis]|uniref:HEPN domain-containing protein n=1 Tax=Sulfurisphaera javensis TaxID=2049879 RepID=UPI0034E8A458